MAPLPDMFNLPGRQYNPNALKALGRTLLKLNQPTGGPPAGYTYLGQFIAHDLTRLSTDQSPPLQHGDEPQQFRNPLLDLDTVYGPGMELEDDGSMTVGLTQGETPTKSDLPRGIAGAPRIPDPRNDDNLFIAQIHVLFLRLHNTILEHHGRHITNPIHRFNFAREQTTLIYHEIVRTDFLQTMLDSTVYEEMVENGNFQTWDKPEVPKEFAMAAFRFGHSMVQGQYIPRPKRPRPLSHFLQMNGRLRFNTQNTMGLPELERPDWRTMFFADTGPYQRPKDLPKNLAKGLSPFISLQIFPEGRYRQMNMAIRNLLRGDGQLPSGQAIVNALNKNNPTLVNTLSIERLTAADLKLRDGIFPANSNFSSQTPLWYYLMAEADVIGNNRRLGPLASYIIADVILGLLKNSSHSGKKPVLPPSGKQWSMNELVYDVLPV